MFKKILSLWDKKTRNRYMNEKNYKNVDVELKSYPTKYVIGINNICNLKCPLCVTGIREQEKNARQMDFSLFKEIVDKISPYAEIVDLYNWGEPLLHKRFMDMLRYCQDKKLRTRISSNLSLKNIDDKLEKLVEYKLDTIIVSLDGVNQKDYERYRVNGDFELVLSNVKKLGEFKKLHNSVYPKIIFQYLRNKYTDDQVSVIEDKHKEWGADTYVVYDMCTIFKDMDNENHEKWFTKEEIKERKYMDIDVGMHGKVCHFLYTTMLIEQDGSIPPCCFSTESGDDFGKWDGSKSILEMYNNDNFRSARQLFRSNKKTSEVVCGDCPVYITYSRSHTEK